MIASVLHLSQLFLLSLASHNVGQYLRKWNLPAISGYLLTGIVSGPYVLVMINNEATKSLRIVDEVALSCIAFAAGSELFYPDLRHQLRTILFMLLGLITCTFVLLFGCMLVLSPHVHFFSLLPLKTNVAICLLVATVLLARSPASAIAVVKELKASGPFTTIAVSVSVAVDVTLVIIFSVAMELSHTIISDTPFQPDMLIYPAAKLVSSFIVAYMSGKLVEIINELNIQVKLKTLIVVLCGFSLFHFGTATKLVEPLLTCVLCSVVVTNSTHKHDDYIHLIDRVLPYVNVVFFTLAGANLAINTLVETWWLSLTLFLVRLVALVLGSTMGTYLSLGTTDLYKIRWMGFVTQAGVGMGLAKEVAVNFPNWGPTFASMVISVIVLNELCGPPLFRYALVQVDEAKAAQKANKDTDPPSPTNEQPPVV
eukprot:TRINITY_DN31600_c0_g1_i1.p1 TRINITY_DN31600_c0_g1~~TRINITY_DN31600_c0_g1_i1.p1  ORF type:complete len:426 (-),score=6.64 TRINITY_DN31600_c0_g1_i1:19-1296(-)